MARDPDGAPTICAATPADRVAVARVLDGALLEVDDLGEHLDDGEVLLADDGGNPVGALVVAEAGPIDRTPPCDWPDDAAHVRAIAVRRKRRRSGIGTALLERARERWSPIVADFEADVADFYAANGAEIRTDAEDRHWALLREQ